MYKLYNDCRVAKQLARLTRQAIKKSMINFRKSDSGLVKPAMLCAMNIGKS